MSHLQWDKSKNWPRISMVSIFFFHIEQYIFIFKLMISISDSIDAQDDNPEDVSEIIESFRQKAVNLLELLDLSIPTIAKLRVNINIK